MMKYLSFQEFVNEAKKQPTKKIQFLKVDPVHATTDNKDMKRLTEEARDRFFEVILIGDKKIPEIMEKMDDSLPLLVYAGSKSEDVEKMVMEIYEKSPKRVYNLPENMKKTGSKVEFHKIFDKENYIPKTVFKIDETEKLKYPIIAKPAEGHSGLGIEKFDSLKELKASKNKFDLYSEFVDFDREFRMLCVKDKPILVYERQLIESENKSIETKEADEKVAFVYIDQDMSKLKFMDELNSIVEDFMKKVPLGVYSLDFFTEKSGGIKIIEANSCSGLGANSLVYVYEEMFEDFYGSKVSGDDAKFINETKKEYRKIVEADYPKEYKKSLMPKQ